MKSTSRRLFVYRFKFNFIYLFFLRIFPSPTIFLIFEKQYMQHKKTVNSEELKS
jgi:hypothetical protein